MMNRKPTLIWGAAVLVVAMLNIFDVLPDWTTITAVLTLAFVAAASGSRCTPGRGR